MGIFSALMGAFFGSGVATEMQIDALEMKKASLQSEVDVMAQEANARLVDLEQNELTNAPAYSQWQENGSVRFGVKGKTYQEVQKEFWRIKNFLDSKTSTVTGAREVLSNISAMVGLDTVMTGQQASNYFRLADKIREYYQMSGESAKALDYMKIWEVIDMAIEKGYATLDKTDYTVEDIETILSEIEGIETEIETLKAMEDMAMNGSGSIGSRIIGGVIGAISGIVNFFKKITR